MNDLNANQMSTVRRKEWCRALNKIPYACVTARDIAMLMNVCKTTSIEILKAAGGIKIGRAWRVDKADLITYLAGLESITMTAKTVASLLDAALPVGGTRGVAAHVAYACGAAERTANGPALVDNTGSAYKMDSMDGANAPTPIIHIKTTVTPEEWLLLCKKEGSRNEGRGVGVRNTPKLIEEESTKRLEKIARSQEAIDDDWFVKGKWLWVTGKDQDEAAVEATLKAIATGSEFEFASAKQMVSAWNSADLYGSNNKDRTLDKYRSVQNLLVSYLGYSRDKTEVSMLYELLDERRLNKLATILSSIYSGKELRSYYLRLGAKAEEVDKLFDCLKKTVCTTA